LTGSLTPGCYDLQEQVNDDGFKAGDVGMSQVPSSSGVKIGLLSNNDQDLFWKNP
jgi:hypothetical protein